jgi:tetratricopeptide (TPR) repeat protein
MHKAIAGKSDADEAWYRTLLVMLYEAGNYQESVKVLTQLIEKFPSNKQYWLQLIAMYQQMNQYKQALAVNELAYREGLVASAAEILDLANLMSHQNAPYRAAELLEREIASGRLADDPTSWEKVANAWSQAREPDRAVSALKKASTSDPTGELNFRAGYLYVKQEKWRDAHEELSDALRKGGLKDPGNAHLLLGITCYELHLHKQARDSFIKARQYSSTRDSGRQWLDYIDSEG